MSLAATRAEDHCSHVVGDRLPAVPSAGKTQELTDESHDRSMAQIANSQTDPAFGVRARLWACSSCSATRGCSAAFFAPRSSRVSALYRSKIAGRGVGALTHRVVLPSRPLGTIWGGSQASGLTAPPETDGGREGGLRGSWLPLPPCQVRAGKAMGDSR